jgi:hypothetical protein
VSKLAEGRVIVSRELQKLYSEVYRICGEIEEQVYEYRGAHAGESPNNLVISKPVQELLKTQLSYLVTISSLVSMMGNLNYYKGMIVTVLERDDEIILVG